MTDATSTAPRAYRLSPRDRTGWMFGLSLAQLLIVAVGIVTGTVLMVIGAPLVGFAVMAMFGTVGVLRVQATPLVELIPRGARYLRATRSKQTIWLAPLPGLGGDSMRRSPFALDGLELLVIDTADLGDGQLGAQIAVSHDVINDTIAATLRVAGRQFGLLEPGEQDWLVAQWGIVLQAFVNERTPVVSVRWSQWAAPTGLDAHRRWLHEHLAPEPVPEVRAAYDELLRDAGTVATRHETLVTVTVHVGKVRDHRATSDRLTSAVGSLLQQTGLFAQRMHTAGLIVSAPLSPAEWTRAMRLRLDPAPPDATDGRVRALGDREASGKASNAGPLAAQTSWTAWRTDSVWHRALYVADWPRLDVHATWMRDLLLYAGCPRTVTVVFEPVARSKSQRSIVRDAAKIESDAAHRVEKGFRVGARHRRAMRAVEEREEELVAGYSEFTYAGIIAVTGHDLDELDRVTFDISQVAASIGVDLRPLHGRHDLAVLATLPVARGVIPKAWQ